MSRSPRCRRVSLDAVLQSAATQLPPGWQIRVVVERSSGWVELFKPDGSKVVLNPDLLIDGNLPLGVACAIEIAKTTADLTKEFQS
jgi:hypothetical protein